MRSPLGWPRFEGAHSSWASHGWVRVSHGQRSCLYWRVDRRAFSAMLRPRFGSSGPAAGGRLRDCFFLQVGDETGVIDVMVLGATVSTVGGPSRHGTAQSTALADGLTQQCARLRTGQIVVIGGAATGRDGAGRLRLICDSEQGSVLHCASVYGAALHLAVPAIVTLHDGVSGEAHRFTAKAVVVEVAGLSHGGQCTWDVYAILDIIFGTPSRISRGVTRFIPPTLFF